MAVRAPVAIDEFNWEVDRNGNILRSIPPEQIDKATVLRLAGKLTAAIAAVDGEIAALQIRRAELVARKTEFDAVLAEAK